MLTKTVYEPGPQAKLGKNRRMILGERINRALARATSSLKGLSDETLQEQLAEIASIEEGIHDLLDDWGQPPESLRQEIGAMDNRFIVAGELFLDVCDAILTALQERDLEPLEEARTTLSQAYKELARAEEAANKQMKRWVQAGQLPTRPDLTA